MTTETKSLAVVQGSNTPAFLADAVSSLSKMEAYADLLIQSGLVPKHFYELDQYRAPKKVDGKFVGNKSAVIMTIQHGLELGMSMTQALQQIVPVNGLMSLKGDGAKALIMRSGLCDKWVEKEIGAKGTDTFGIEIYSKRKDGQEITRTFTVQDAKRAGLWITDDMVAKDAKFGKSPWYRYQPRMLRYRCLGFMARDLYGDVLQNMYTEDEAMDMDVDNTTFQTPDGITAKVENKKGEAMNADALAALNKGTVTIKSDAVFAATNENKDGITHTQSNIQDAVYEEIPESNEKTYTEAELKKMTGPKLLELAVKVTGLDLNTLIYKNHPQKRTVKLITLLILAKQGNVLKSHLKDEYGIELPESTQPEASEEKSSEWIETSDINAEAKPEQEKSPEPHQETPPPFQVDPGEDGRGFEELIKIDELARSNGAAPEKIMAYIAEKGLSFDKPEAFYRHGTFTDLKTCLNIA